MLQSTIFFRSSSLKEVFKFPNCVYESHEKKHLNFCIIHSHHAFLKIQQNQLSLIYTCI